MLLPGEKNTLGSLRTRSGKSHLFVCVYVGQLNAAITEICKVSISGMGLKYIGVHSGADKRSAVHVAWVQPFSGLQLQNTAGLNQVHR